MEVEPVVSVVSDIGELLQYPKKTDKSDMLLNKIGDIVQQTSQNENYRNRLAISKVLWQAFEDSLSHVKPSDSINTERRCNYIRCIRAIVLLMRNLSASDQVLPGVLSTQEIVLKSIVKVLSSDYDEMTVSLYRISLEFLHNVSKRQAFFDAKEMDSMIFFLQYPLGHVDEVHQALLPYAMLFLQLTVKDGFLYYFVRHSACQSILYNILILEIAQSHSSLVQYLHGGTLTHNGNELSTMDAVLLQIFVNLGINESYSILTANLHQENNADLETLLKLTQLAITSKSSWNNMDLTGVLSWCFPLFKEVSQAINSYFSDKKEDLQMAQNLHNKLSISLDILVSLCHYEHVQEYILSYNGLEILINLFQVLNDNQIKINIHKVTHNSKSPMKITDSCGNNVIDKNILHSRIDKEANKILATNFPECKSLIVEILTMLTHKRPVVQDKIRELHGLELILSNCNIDDNEPFIKERSIICLKFLLEDNIKNKDFVAKLEARKAVQDEIISEAGYEIKIGDNGKISLSAQKNEES